MIIKYRQCDLVLGKKITKKVVHGNKARVPF